MKVKSMLIIAVGLSFLILGLLTPAYESPPYGYSPPPSPPPLGKATLWVRAFYIHLDGSQIEVEASGSIVETGQTFTTPVQLIVDPINPALGTGYWIKVTYKSETKNLIVTELEEGQILDLTFRFYEPSPPTEPPDSPPPALSTVTFFVYVFKTAEPLSGAAVNFNQETKGTDTSGLAIFYGVADGDYSWSVNYAGESKTGTTNISQNTTINVSFKLSGDGPIPLSLESLAPHKTTLQLLGTTITIAGILLLFYEKRRKRH